MPKKTRAQKPSSSSFDRSVFVSEEAAKRFEERIVKRAIIPQRYFLVDQTPCWSNYFPHIQARGWDGLCHPLEGGCLSLVREFYANVSERRDYKVFVRGQWVLFTKEVINSYYSLPTMGDEEGFLKLLSEIDMATVSASVCKPGTVWKMSGDVYKNFSRSGLLDTVRPWYAFVCVDLLPTAHLSDVTRERAILLYAIVSGASVDVGRVIFDYIMQCARAAHGGIGFPCLISAICASQGVMWDRNEEMGGVMRPIDGPKLAEFLGIASPPKKRRHSTVGASASSSQPRVQFVDHRLGTIERILDYQGEHIRASYSCSRGPSRLRVHSSCMTTFRGCLCSLGVT